jgi:hypothetical protein
MRARHTALDRLVRRGPGCSDWPTVPPEMVLDTRGIGTYQNTSVADVYHMVCHDPFIKPVQPKERRVLQNVFARTVSTVPQALPVCFSVDKNLSGTWWWSGWKPQVFIPAVIIRRAFIFTLVMHLLLRCPCSACFGSPFEPSEHRFTLAIRVTHLPAMAVRVSTRTTQQESEETRFVRVCRTQVIEQGGLGLSVPCLPI